MRVSRMFRADWYRNAAGSGNEIITIERLSLAIGTYVGTTAMEGERTVRFLLDGTRNLHWCTVLADFVLRRLDPKEIPES